MRQGIANIYHTLLWCVCTFTRSERLKCLPNSGVPMNPSGETHLWPELPGQRLTRLVDDFVRSGPQLGNLDHLNAGDCVYPLLAPICALMLTSVQSCD